MTGGPKPLPHEGLAGPVCVVCDILAGAAADRFVLAIPFAGTAAIAALVTEVARPCHIVDVARNGVEGAALMEWRSHNRTGGLSQS